MSEPRNSGAALEDELDNIYSEDGQSEESEEEPEEDSDEDGEEDD